VVSPAIDNDAVTVAEFADQARVSEQTVRNWIEAWVALGVTGIREVPARNGRRFVFTRDLVARWRRCELPVPRLPDKA
jgi:hypothetical protein